MIQIALFAAPLLGGVALFVACAGVWRSRRNDPITHALLGACLPAAVALFSTPHGPTAAWIGRLHEPAIALLAAGLVHLALSFPIDHLRGRRSAGLLVIYLAGLALAAIGQVVAGDPTTAATVRGITISAAAAGGAALALALLIGTRRAPTVLERRRAALAGLGALPVTIALLLSPSSAAAGVAVELAAPTAFLFPLAVGAALRSANLIEIDALLRRVLSAAVLSATVAATYLLTWLVLYGVDPRGTLLGSVPSAIAVLNLAIVFLLAPVRDAARTLVGRVVAPPTYDSEACLLALSRGLASARTAETIVGHARTVLASAIDPTFAAVYVPDGLAEFRPTAGSSRHTVVVPPVLIRAFECGETVVVDDLAGARDVLPAPWNAVDTGLLMPLRASGTVVGLLVLGRPRSRRPYGIHDLTFLRSAAYQMALALQSNAAFEELDEANRRLAELNTDLERQVAERTTALQAKNAALNDSLADLQRAYRKLEDHQAGVLRAERLATLGRLTAGLAHEVNTPLSAVMNALTILGDLGREYEAAVSDPEVLPEDHREIAREIQATTASATEWARKAAAYIRTFKSHTREGSGPVAAPFALRALVEETQGLIAHRLRASGCQVEISEEPTAISLIGDRAQFGQVVVNLLANAADAYEERGSGGGRIAVHAMRGATGGVRVRVTDWAGGIPPAVLPHIFEELYTTKRPGRGTGLGLWIARALVEQGFGGTLDVLTSPGSTCFVLDLPPAACAAPVATTRTPARWRATDVGPRTPDVVSCVQQ
jgi:signal transduction histidine kinase